MQSENVVPVQGSIQLNDVGGPSAGMMFALGIIDKLTPGGPDRRQGHRRHRHHRRAGNVGAIGGIQMKTDRRPRRRRHRVPGPRRQLRRGEGEPPSGLELVKVNTLSDALTALNDIKDGKTPPLC